MSNLPSFLISVFVVFLTVFAHGVYKKAHAQQVAAVRARSFLFQLSQQIAFFASGSVGQALMAIKHPAFEKFISILKNIRDTYERHESCSAQFMDLAKLTSHHPSGNTDAAVPHEIRTLLGTLHDRCHNMHDLEYASSADRLATILNSLQTDFNYPYGNEAAYLSVGLNAKLEYLRNIYLTILLRLNALLVMMRVCKFNDATCKHIDLEVREIMRQQHLLYTQTSEIWFSVDQILDSSVVRLAYANIANPTISAVQKTPTWQWFCRLVSWLRRKWFPE